MNLHMKYCDGTLEELFTGHQHQEGAQIPPQQLETPTSHTENNYLQWLIPKVFVPAAVSWHVFGYHCMWCSSCLIVFCLYWRHECSQKPCRWRPGCGDTVLPGRTAQGSCLLAEKRGYVQIISHVTSELSCSCSANVQTTAVKRQIPRLKQRAEINVPRFTQQKLQYTSFWKRNVFSVQKV